MSDYQLNDTVHLMFTSRQFSDGVPTAISGGVVDIYEDATATPIITGETFVASLNSVVGLNVITITATSGTGFNANGTYNAVMQAGTVGGDSIIGEVVGTFTIEKDSVNWAKVAAPTTAVDLSATDFQLVDTAIAVTTVNGLAANVITAAATAADHIDLIWDETLAGHVTADTTGLLLNDWQDAGRLDLILDIIAADVVNIDGAAMRGTDSVPVASVTGTSDSGTTTTMVDSNRTEIDTHWVGSYIRFGSGGSANNVGVTRMIDTFTAASDTIRFNPAVLTAITTETYEILPVANVDEILIDTAELQQDWTDAGRLDAILDIIAADVVNIDGQAMRGTNSALLAADINLTAGAVDTVTTLTGHTAQTADHTAAIADIPTVSEFNARTILSASYFDPVADTVVNVTNVATLTGHTNQTGDSFARIGAAGASLTDLGGMSTAMKAEVLVEINAALDTAISEITQGVPAITPSIRTGIMLMYMALRNQLDVQTSGTDALEIHNNAGTQIAIKLLTDDGSDYREATMTTGV